MIKNSIDKLITVGLPGPVKALFTFMEIAEEEISKAKLTKAQGSIAFAALCPSAPLSGKAPDLYRAHARELCQRIKKGTPLAPATDAELLAVFSDTSGVAPMHGTAADAMEVLFRSCFPSAKLDGPPAGHELHPGATRELIEKTRRKFTMER